MASSHRPFPSPPLCQGVALPHGDIYICPTVSVSWGLDGVHRPPRCLPSGSSPSGISSVFLVLCRPPDFPILCFVFWPVDGSTGLYTCHGPDLLHHSSLRFLDPPLPGQLAHPGVLISRVQTGEELPHSVSVPGLSRHDSPDRSFEGFPDSGSGLEDSLSCRLLRLLSSSASVGLEVPSWSYVVLSALVPGAQLWMQLLQLHLNVAGALVSEVDLVSWDDSCLSDLRWWSVFSHLVVGVPLDLPCPDLSLFMDA